MSSDKPEPMATIPAAARRICPVCHKPSYSPRGIHPQCAMVQADAPRQARLAAERKAKPKPKKKSRWEQTCPKCKVRVHVRRKVCACGYEFPPTRAGEI